MGEVTNNATATVFSDVLRSFGFEFVFFCVTIGVALLLRSFRRRSTLALKKSQKGLSQPPAVPAGKTKPLRQEAPEGRGAETSATSTPCPAPRPKKKDTGVSTLSQAVDQTITGRMSTSKALAFYEELRAQGSHKTLVQDLAAASSRHSALAYFTALVQCAGRASRADALEALLDDMVVAGLQRPLSIYESAMRLLAGKKCFKEALAVYDRLAADGLEPSPVSLSCLVGFAAELGNAERAITFFDKLAAVDEPSIRACMTILRVYARKKDFVSSLKVLDGMKKRGSRIDSLVLNLVLDTGVAAGASLGQLLTLLEQEPGATVADVVSHNIVLKALSQRGDAAGAAQLLQAMRARGVSPNLISYNTALDASVRGRQFEDAWCLLAELQQAGLRPDKCTCSVLVKALASGRIASTAARIEMVLKLASEPRVLSECSQQLRASLFSGLLEAACSPPVRDGGLAMRIFAAMREQQLSLATTELRALAATVALEGDAESCQMIWLFAAANCPALERCRASLDAYVSQGMPVDVATLKVLGPPAEPDELGTSPTARQRVPRVRPSNTSA